MATKNGKINSLTKAQLMLICQQIVNAAKVELAYSNCNYDKQCAIRAVAYRSLNEIWYEIVPEKLRAKFNYDAEVFKKECWPMEDNWI